MTKAQRRRDKRAPEGNFVAPETGRGLLPKAVYIVRVILEAPPRLNFVAP